MEYTGFGDLNRDVLIRNNQTLGSLVTYFRDILQDIMFNNLVPHLIAKPSVYTHINFFMTPTDEAIYSQIYSHIDDIKMTCVRINIKYEQAASDMIKVKEIVIRKTLHYQQFSTAQREFNKRWS